ncbi:MAG TPA: SpoIIE family protein phosphatase [Solirubrobacteraceae bacterium]|nr:SpoIIE family protein phosphatase [Solirubrobacteraceae bacterium]
MATGGESPGFRPRTPGAGQTVLPPVALSLAPSEQVRSLSRLSDPALSELGLEELLDELLIRVRDVLAVDTVAILLYDPESDQLVARAAKGIEEEVEHGVRVPVGQGFAGRIAEERVAIFIADVNHADILNPILREKGIHSLLGVPLIVEGDLIGVLHVGSLTFRSFDARDLAVLQVAAARAAPGIERARLVSAFEHEHRVAMVLQRSLLPKRLAEFAGVSAAARYLPATDDVGGDWYDVFELPRGRIGVAIGDVVGHGVRAAALMGQLRTALHAYAAEGHGPARTLELVDRFVQAMPEPGMATAAYAVLDTDTGALTLASAGHLPPLIVRPDEVIVVEVAPAPPLGAIPYGSCTEVEVRVEPGEMIMLYTDGLVERRGVPLTDSIDLLCEIVGAANSAEEICRLAFDHLIPEGGPRDDVAVVALQAAEIPPELHMRLSADPQVLADTRRILRRWLRAGGAGDLATMEITLAVSEACTNAIEHAYSPAPAAFQLHASVVDGTARIVVSDAGRWRPPRGTNRGRGLKIIESAMDEVVVDAAPSGTQIVMTRRLGR